MPEFSIESNGMIESTAVYYNGEQLAGVREVLLNIDETGVFDAVISYEDETGAMQTRQIFSDYLHGVRTREAAFTHEEAQALRLLTVQSDGDLESTIVAIDGEEQFGIIHLFAHIKAPPRDGGRSRSWFRKQADPTDRAEFRVEVTYRNDDDTTETEGVF